MNQREFKQNIEKHLEENRQLSQVKWFPDITGEITSQVGLNFWRIGLAISFIITLILFDTMPYQLIRVIKVLLLL